MPQRKRLRRAPRGARPVGPLFVLNRDGSALLPPLPDPFISVADVAEVLDGMRAQRTLPDPNEVARQVLRYRLGREPFDEEVSGTESDIRTRRMAGGGPAGGGPFTREEIAEIIVQLTAVRIRRRWPRKARDRAERIAREAVDKARAAELEQQFYGRDPFDPLNFISMPGRPSELNTRIEAIVAAARQLGAGATRLRVAQALGRVDGWGQERSDYRGDVRAAGGWAEIKRLAGL